MRGQCERIIYELKTGIEFYPNSRYDRNWTAYRDWNSYITNTLTPEEAAESPAVEYGEAEAFLKSQEDFASSRTRSQIFRDSEGNFRRLTVSLPTFEQEVLVEHVFWWTMMLFLALLISVIWYRHGA